MALTSVRVQFNGTWYNMALNSATGKYEATITAPSTPQDDVPILVRAVNKTGYQAEAETTVDIRQEVVAPVVTITSPVSGNWYTNNQIPISFSLTDEGGSGVSLPTLSFVLDGETLGSTSPGMVCTASGNGYACTYTSPTALSEGQHTVSISVEDGAGNPSNTASISFGIDASPPQVVITYPADGFITVSDSIEVTGTASDAGGGISSVTVNGVVATLNGEAFTATVPLSSGQNTITATATDTVGNTAQDTVTVARATSGPSLVITSPVDGSATNVQTISVTGTVSDSVSTVSSVTVNGVQATITGGTFSASVTLSNGQNTITVVAGNAVGLNTTETVTVTLDTDNPVLNVASPADGAILSSNTVPVSGTATDTTSGIASLAVNGSAVPVGTDGSFSANVAMPDGAGSITVTATDRAGNTTQVTRSITVDTSPPQLVVVSPADGLITAQASLTVSGTVEDSISGVASVLVNGQSAELSGGTFSLAVTLSESENEITVTATNGAGLSTTISRSVILDTVPPVLTVESPTGGEITTNPSFTLSGTASDATSGISSVTINGEAVDLTGGAFSKSVSLLEGTNQFVFVATDNAGLQTTVTRSVMLDTVDPALSVTSPPDDLMTNNPTLTISGTASDAASGLATVTINGSPVTVTEGAFSHAVTLTEGTNDFTIVATDAVGHTSTVERSVLLDTVAPAFVLVVIQPNMDAEPLGGSFVLTVTMAESEVSPKSTETVTGTVNGAPVTFTESPECTWTAIVPRAEEDVYTVSLAASDEAGNSASYSITFPCGLGGKWTWTPLEYLNFWDLNRIEYNTRYLYDWLQQEGYGTRTLTTKTNWTKEDIPRWSDIQRIRENVDYLQECYFSIPEWREIVYNDTIDASQMNAFEWDLHLIDLWLSRMVSFRIYSGMLYSGVWP